MSLKEMFELYEDKEFLKFERIVNPKSKRPDLHAFLLLDGLIPAEGDIVSAAEHNIIYLDIDVEELEKVITEDQVLELVRCGIMYETEYDCLATFV